MNKSINQTLCCCKASKASNEKWFKGSIKKHERQSKEVDIKICQKIIYILKITMAKSVSLNQTIKFCNNSNNLISQFLTVSIIAICYVGDIPTRIAFA